VYYDPEGDVYSKNIFGPDDILYKRSCFSWEKEYRLWFNDDEIMRKIEADQDIEEAKIARGHSFNAGNLQELIKRLVIAPGADDSFIALVKGVCAAYQRNWLGKKVERSSTGRLWDSFATNL
jgi:hypothetical protein